MKIKSGFLLKEIAGDFVVVPVDSNFVDFGAMMTLNESGAFLWNCLLSDTTVDQLAEKLAGEYEVDIVTAREDISGFVEKLSQKGLLDRE